MIVSPGFGARPIPGQQFPGDGDFLDVAFSIRVNDERLPATFPLGVLDFPLVELLAIDQTDHIAAIPAPPGRDVGRLLAGVGVVGLGVGLPEALVMMRT